MNIELLKKDNKFYVKLKDHVFPWSNDFPIDGIGPNLHRQYFPNTKDPVGIILYKFKEIIEDERR